MKSCIKIILFLFVQFVCISGIAQTQKEANVWYFGKFLGIDFNSGTAVPINNGQLTTVEGVATICDVNGNLLFYTDGIKIWNKLHQVMPNGTGLFGDPSSSQSAVIVPKIDDPGRYIVFTVDAVKFVSPPATFVDTKGLNYSIVNMALDNGNGDVETKNVPLTKNSVEKITAVRHCNNKDVWVVAHDTASNGYYSYLVTAAGVNPVPVISHTGIVLPGLPRTNTTRIDSSFLGYLKASPNGRKIAAAHWTRNVDLSDFDIATGVVSNTVSLHDASEPYALYYGVEFSPDSRLLYSTAGLNPNTAGSIYQLLQYDVTQPTPAAIIASKQTITQTGSFGLELYGALQNAPDGKIYMALNSASLKYISAINNPNVYGTGCNYVLNALQWSGATQASTFGLPAFVQSYFYPPDSFTYTISCNTAQFNYTPAAEVNSIRWDFGDVASGANNTSTINNPTHTFTTAGLYTVKLIRFTNCGSDTLTKQINSGAIDLYLGPDTTVCGATSLLLNGPAAGSTNTFLWQNGATTPTFTATTSGLYWVQVTSGTCSKRDSINVTFSTSPVYNLGPDGPICSGDTLILNATVAGATYLWNTGAVTATIKAYQAGTYWCDVKKNGCTFRDSLIITAVNPSPTVNLGNDITVCQGIPVLLNATNPNATYLWQDASTNATYSPTVTGLYWVEVTNTIGGCKKRDSINVTFTSAPIFNLGADGPVCSGDTLTLNATVTGSATYLWNTGATTATIKAYQAGTYWCNVSRNGCSFRDSLIITAVNPAPVLNLGNDIIVCQGVPVTLNATNPNATYLWQDASTNATYSPAVTGLYWVEVTNTIAGCKKRDSINVTFTTAPVFTLGPDLPVCAGIPVIFNATTANATSYTWSTGATTATISAVTPGLYWCEVARGSCSFRDSVVITGTKPSPVVNLGADQTVCEGTTVTLNAAFPAATYLWNDGSTNPVFTVTTAGTYVVTLDLNGCKKSDTVIINYNLKPRFTLGPDQFICPGNTITLAPTLDPLWQLSWQDGSQNATYIVKQVGQYALTATNNCGATTDAVVVSKGLCTINIPNAFTPNNDSKNDVFKIYGTDLVTSFNLKIFNRYGQIVFETDDKNKGWDGKFNGTASPGGGFVYLLNYKESTSTEQHIVKGTFILIR